jgi:L-methionine (R)-S-oxide reductase
VTARSRSRSDKFAGHLACDVGSRSEIIIPILRAEDASAGELVAVLDLDRDDLGAFDGADAEGLAPIAEPLGTLAW